MSRLRFSMALALALVSAPAPASAGAIDGLWQQVDDKTGRVNSLVRVASADGATYAVIVKGYPAPGRTADPDARCTGCPGRFLDQRMIGLRFMWDLKPDGAGWDGGQILDPDERKIYRVKATLSADEKSLTVRGYIGIPLLGRSQVWRRYTGPEE